MNDPYPSPETVADQLKCNKAACIEPASCWTKGGCILRYRVDPKGRSRIRNSGAMRRKVLRDRECRFCGNPAEDPHHILYRSLSGDDTENNIVGLCRACHDILHFAAGPEYEQVRRGIGESLTREEIRYVLGRLGEIEGRSFLERAYFLTLPESWN